MARQMNRVTPENPTAFTAGGPVPKSIIHAPTRAIHGRYSRTDHHLREPLGNPTKCVCVCLFAYVGVMHAHTPAHT